MRNIWLYGLAIVGLAVLVQAQDDPRPARPEQAQEAPPGPPLIALPSPTQLARRLTRELELTAEQQAALEEITARHEALWQERAERNEGFRQLAMQYRQARDSGDDKRAEAIAQQMRDLGGGRGQVLREYLQDVETSLQLQPQQVQQLNRFRQRLREPGARRDMIGGGLRQLLRRLPEELNLTPEQRVRYDELMSELRAGAEQRRDRRAELRNLMVQLQEAREAGDEQRATDLEMQIDTLRASAPNPQELLARLEPILSEDQKARLAQLRSRFAPRDTAGTEMRRILGAARRLHLNEEQRDRLREIYRQSRESQRAVGADAQARDQLARDLKSQIKAMLDANQAREFERLLERSEREERRGGRDAGETPRRQGPSSDSPDE